MDKNIENNTGNQSNVGLYEYILEKCKPTKQDLERVITTNEQKQLCLKHKCKVDAWKWNPVYEYRLAYEDKGRYQKWSHKKKMHMLAKSVNSNKATAVYSDDEIAQTRKNEWEMQKKQSILSLNLWAYDKTKKENNMPQNTAIANNENVDDTYSNPFDSDEDDFLFASFETDILSNSGDFQNAVEVSKQVQPTYATILNSDEIANMESFALEFNLSFHNQEVEMDAQQTNVTTLNSDVTDPAVQELFNLNTESITIDTQLSTNDLTSTPSEILSNNDDSQTAVDVSKQVQQTNATILNSDEFNLPFHNKEVEMDAQQTNVTTLNSEVTDPAVQQLFNLNTESITIDTQLSTNNLTSTPFENNLHQSQDVLAADYENFNQEIPASSTQLLYQKFEEMV